MFRILLNLFKRQFSANVPNLFPFSAARQMAEPFHRLKFAGGSTYYAQIRAGVAHFVNQKGKQKVCSMYQDSDFGREIHFGVVDQVKGPSAAYQAQQGQKAAAAKPTKSFRDVQRAKGGKKGGPRPALVPINVSDHVTCLIRL